MVEQCGHDVADLAACARSIVAGSAATSRHPRSERPQIASPHTWFDVALQVVSWSIRWWQRPSVPGKLMLSIVGYEFGHRFRCFNSELMLRRSDQHRPFRIVPRRQPVNGSDHGLAVLACLRWFLRTNGKPRHPGRFCASASIDFLLVIGSCRSPCMSADGCLYATRWRPFLDLGTFFKPFQNFVFDEPPEPALPFAERMRRNIAKPGPTDRGPAVHPHDGSGLAGVENLHPAAVQIELCRLGLSGW